MPWHRSTGYFVPAVWWRIFGQIGLLTLASLSLACRRSPGRQTGGSVFKASSTRLQKICRDIVPQAALCWRPFSKGSLCWSEPERSHFGTTFRTSASSNGCSEPARRKPSYGPPSPAACRRYRGARAPDILW